MQQRPCSSTSVYTPCESKRCPELRPRTTALSRARAGARAHWSPHPSARGAHVDRRAWKFH
eukprot:8108994-Alexandrium_andersonii.AAC.1